MVCTSLNFDAINQYISFSFTAPEAFWFHNENEIKPTNTLKMKTDKDYYILTVMDCKPEGEGWYRIVAKNGGGECTSAATLTVQSEHNSDVIVIID